MEKIKKDIEKITKNYRINKKYLRSLIKRYYEEGSRMDYWITHPKYLRPIKNEIKVILWREHGIPHIIWDNLLYYMSDDVVQEAIID